MRIVVVEDEPKVGKALQSGFERDGYAVTLATTGEEGFFLASAQRFDMDDRATFRVTLPCSNSSSSTTGDAS